MYNIEILTENNRMLMRADDFTEFVEAQRLQIFNERNETVYTIFNGIIVERIEWLIKKLWV